MDNEPTESPGVRYRVFFYTIGIIFAITTYVLGVWLYSFESASPGNRPLPSIWLQLKEIQLNHLFTFVTWVCAVTIVSAAIGYLLDREVSFRRCAEKKTSIDILTGCHSHRYFQERLNTEIERAYRYNRQLALAMFDLDDFKEFNNQYGHAKGDQLLKKFTEMCRSDIRIIDILARYGGEEFVVILPEAGTNEAEAVANRIREAFHKEINSSFPEGPTVTVSIGITAYPEHGQTRHSLVLNADTALYHAKQTGKNKAVIYEESLKKNYRATTEKLKAMLNDNHMEAIEALSTAVDAKDHYTRGHSDSVTRYSVALAQKMGLSKEETENLRAAALLHDIGKIGTPDAILRKPGPLKIDEWHIIEDHPRIGSEILEKVQQLNSIVPAVRHHHERFDGLGYPNGLSGKSIPLISRIIALADSYDAMTSERTYRKALSSEDAIEEIKRCAGTQFDPDLIDMFVEIVKENIDKKRQEAA